MKDARRLSEHLTRSATCAAFVPAAGLAGEGPSDPEHVVYTTLTASL